MRMACQESWGSFLGYSAERMRPIWASARLCTTGRSPPPVCGKWAARAPMELQQTPELASGCAILGRWARKSWPFGAQELAVRGAGRRRRAENLGNVVEGWLGSK